MVKVSYSLVAAVLFVVGAQAIVKDQCSWFVGKHPFDEERITGVWHVIAAASSHLNEVITTCGQYNVTYEKSNEDEKYMVKFSGLDKEKKLVSFEGISKPMRSDKRSMFLGVTKKSDGENYEGVYREAILATDYDTYAVYIGCRATFDPISNKFGRRYVASVVSRKSTLNEDIKNTLINVLSGYNIEPSEFKLMEHEDCPQ